MSIGCGGPIALPAHSPDLTPVDSEEDLLAQVMAVADVGLSGIGDRVYVNILHRYHQCFYF